MNKITIFGGLAVTSLAAYFGMQSYVGHQVENQVALIQQQLVAHNDVRVNKLDYQRGWGQGELHYDLVYRPTAGSPWHELASELLPAGEIHWQGSAQVDHGPWLPGHGPGLAQLQGSIALPEVIRPWLPQYPGQTPVLRYRGETHLDNTISFDAELIDYKGILKIPGEPEQADWAHQGAALQARVHPERQHLQLTAQLPQLQFAVPGEGVSLQLDGLQLELDSTRLQSYVWLGDASLALTGLRLEAEANQLVVEDLSLSSDTHQVAGKLDSAALFELGQVSVDDRVLGASRLHYSLRGLDINGYAGLMRALQRIQDPDDMESAWPALRPHLQRILAAQPSMVLDELSLSLGATHDIKAAMALYYQGDGQLDAAFIDNVWDHLSLTGSAEVAHSAVDALIGLYLQDQGNELDSSEQAMMAELLKQQLNEQLRSNPFARLQEEGVEFAFALQDRMLTAHGQPVMDLDSLLALGSAWLPDNPDLPEQQQELSLSAGFSPDPYVLAATSGGKDQLDDSFAVGCIGYTDLANANVLLHYQAGDYPLIIAATAPSDTALAVLAPDGTLYCNDDRSLYELDPQLIFKAPESGTYLVWLSDLDGARSTAELSFSEVLP